MEESNLTDNDAAVRVGLIQEGRLNRMADEGPSGQYRARPARGAAGLLGREPPALNRRGQRPQDVEVARGVPAVAGLRDSPSRRRGGRPPSTRADTASGESEQGTRLKPFDATGWLRRNSALSQGWKCSRPTPVPDELQPLTGREHVPTRPFGSDIWAPENERIRGPQTASRQTPPINRDRETPRHGARVSDAVAKNSQGRLSLTSEPAWRRVLRRRIFSEEIFRAPPR